jgi:hypothetical protein
MRTGSVNSEITVALFNKFADKIDNKPTIVILDNYNTPRETNNFFESLILQIPNLDKIRQ